MRRIITLTTDFGTRDPFVGAIKGVILSICPKAEIVDITHEVAPFNILEGALALASACDYFPKGTVHLAVVDPGVGTQRKAVAVLAGGRFFVGPDNGVLSLALEGKKRYQAVEIRNPKYRLKQVSATFHGRDIFAPAAAHLAHGVPLELLGPEVKTLRKLRLPPVRKTRKGLVGEVVGFDRFGNALTNVRRETFDVRSRNERFRIQAGDRTVRLNETYGDAKPGAATAVWGSRGHLEIVVNQGSAQEVLGMSKGTRIRISPRSPSGPKGGA